MFFSDVAPTKRGGAAIVAGASFQASLRRQVVNVRRGGLPALWRKAAFVLAALAFLPLVLLARVLHPWISIRFGHLNSYRFGHFAINTELYLCKRDLAEKKRRGIDLFFLGGEISNEQLKTMWSRILPISRFVRHAFNCNKFLPGKEAHIVPLEAAWDVEGILEITQPHLVFTPEEEEQGQRELKRLGLTEGTPFVGIHARDSGYLEYAFPKEAPDKWLYTKHRNSSIHTYIPAAEQLTERGYYVLRTGRAVKEALKCDNPRIFDLATNGRTDFLDVYLGSKCRFYLCDTNGLSVIPMVFRKPVAWVNFIPMALAPTWSSTDLYLPKMLWLTEGKRFLTFPEILGSDIARFHMDELFEEHGIQVIDNTPEEITALALEMDQRLAGTWQTSEEDDELQVRFWALFPERYYFGNRVFRTRMGAEFLRQNRNLLD